MSEKRVIKVANCNFHAVTTRIGWQWVEMRPRTIITATMPKCALLLCIYDSEKKELINAMMMGTATPSAIIYQGTKIATFITESPPKRQSDIQRVID